MAIVWINGAWKEASEAFIPINDRGFLFGDGLFTSICVEKGKVQLWQEHLTRLQKQAKELRIEMPQLSESIAEELIARNSAYKGVWKLKIVISRQQTEGLGLPMANFGTLLFTLEPYTPKLIENYHIAIYPEPITSPTSSFKSLSYLERFLVRKYALDKKKDDALTLSADSFFLECSFANIFWLTEKCLFVPDKSLPYLQGVYVNFLKKKALEKGLKVQDVKWRLEQALDAPLFCCNSLQKVISISSIEEYNLPPAPKNSFFAQEALS